MAVLNCWKKEMVIPMDDKFEIGVYPYPDGKYIAHIFRNGSTVWISPKPVDTKKMAEKMAMDELPIIKEKYNGS